LSQRGLAEKDTPKAENLLSICFCRGLNEEIANIEVNTIAIGR